MSKNTLAWSIVFAAAALSGCATRYADVPTPARFERSQQERLQAAAHWKVIADHAATQIAADMQEKLQGRALFVPQPDGEQAFVAGFRDLLITSLIQKGVAVNAQAANSLVVDVKYSIYKFSPDRAKGTYQYGQLSALAAGVWALGGIAAANSITHVSGVQAGAQLFAGALTLETLGWLDNEKFGNGKVASGPVPRSEIILTMSITDGGRYVSRNSNIYFSTDEDSALYWDKPATGTLITVQSRGDK